MNPFLSIVLPAYNEEANLDRAVRAAAAAAAALVPSYEIVVVDDGSRDGTAEVAQALAAEMGDLLQSLRHPQNRGYGAALRSGFAATRGQLVFYTDSDNQFDLTELGEFLPLLDHWDAALGYRLDRQDDWLRRAVSGFFNRINWLAFGITVQDVNCSFKLFRGDLVRRLPLTACDFFIDTEMVILLGRGGHRYVQRGVRHYPRTAGRSKVRPGDVPRTLAAMARMWARLHLQRPPS